MTDFKGSYCLTHTGRRVYYLAPSSQMIHPEDLAFHLGNMPRFNGATKHYSVAQHCVLASKLAAARGLTRYHQLAALLHDAPEAYMGDIVSTLKQALRDTQPGGFSAWDKLERRLLVAIWTRAGMDISHSRFDEEFFEDIKTLDRDMLAAERVALMPKDELWTLEPPEDAPPIKPWPIEVAQQKYRELYTRLVRSL